MMPRPTTDDVLMECAAAWAERSTCSRLHVGAVFALEGRILVTGYNGAPAKLPHCEHPCTCHLLMAKFHVTHKSDQVHLEGCRSQEPCTTAEHAERNGIAFAARHGIKLEGSFLYTTHQPCAACAMSVINSGVERVYYRHPYRDAAGVSLLRKAGLGVIQWPTP